MPHEVLQCLGIHSRFRHITAIGVSAYMRCNVWHLHPVDVIVSAYHMIESVLPVHCHKWHSIIIVKQESAISIYGFLHFRCVSILNTLLVKIKNFDYSTYILFYQALLFCIKQIRITFRKSSISNRFTRI